MKPKKTIKEYSFFSQKLFKGALTQYYTCLIIYVRSMSYFIKKQFQFTASWSIFENKSFFFVVVKGGLPPCPLSGPTTKKKIICVFPKVMPPHTNKYNSLFIFFPYIFFSFLYYVLYKINMQYMYEV